MKNLINYVCLWKLTMAVVPDTSHTSHTPRIHSDNSYPVQPKYGLGLFGIGKVLCAPKDKAIVLYRTPTCSACKNLETTIEKLEKSGFPIHDYLTVKMLESPTSKHEDQLELMRRQEKPLVPTVRYGGKMYIALPDCAGFLQQFADSVPNYEIPIPQDDTFLTALPNYVRKLDAPLLAAAGKSWAQHCASIMAAEEAPSKTIGDVNLNAAPTVTAPSGKRLTLGGQPLDTDDSFVSDSLEATYSLEDQSDSASDS